MNNQPTPSPQQQPQNPYANLMEPHIAVSQYSNNNSALKDNLQQQFHQVAPNQSNIQLNNPMQQSAQPQSKTDEYRMHKQQNQQDLTTSVKSLNGFFAEQMDGYSFDYRDSDHPMAALFHFTVKGFAILVYLFGGLFVKEEWTIPEIIIVVGAVDFWITKNVTGRLLVGLRWWEEIDETSGQQLWVFETRVNEQAVKQVNTYIFWATLVLAIIAWGFLGVINVLTINIMNLIGISFQIVIQCTNFYFFFMCSRVAKQRAKQLGKVLGAELINKMLTQSVIWPLNTPKQKA